MSDKKLDELIEAYGKEYISYCDEQISYTGKAKQAIIAYVENIKKIINVAEAGLDIIGSETEDIMPPFRAMPASRMKEIARETLAEMKSHE